ncbi:MAG: polysaccharide deacetylase family protein [Pseudomonadales bacterium]|nr:polysaccharide deacetylase family protein [Pseudomonadales bacterium]
MLSFKTLANSAVILQYHHIAATTPSVTSTRVQLFEQHLDYLKKQGFHVLPLPRIVSAFKGDNTLPAKAVSITFDDAYLNLYHNAFPLLKQRKFPFTIFVVTQLVGRPGYLSWDQLREMQHQGATIANHSHSHSHLLRKLSDETAAQWQQRVTREITDAQRQLNSELGTNNKLFAYPYGEYNLALKKIIKQLGYVGFGQQSGAAGKHSSTEVLPRFPLSGIYADFETFKTKVNSLPMPIIEPAQEPEVTDINFRPELTLQFISTEANIEQLVCYGPSGITELIKRTSGVINAKSFDPVPIGRSRYNCTIPVSAIPINAIPANTLTEKLAEGNPPLTKQNTPQYYWYSQLWIRKNNDGSWYQER